jgi:hypothetical protein
VSAQARQGRQVDGADFASWSRGLALRDDPDGMTWLRPDDLMIDTEGRFSLFAMPAPSSASGDGPFSPAVSV